MDRRQRFIRGLIVLLLTPLVVLAAFALYAHLANARTQTGQLRTRVSPEIVLPWGESVYYMDFTGFNTEAPTPAVTPKPPQSPPSEIDLVFIVDESSSMTNSIATMADAAKTVVQDLAKEKRGRFRYAAVRFDDSAQTQTNWTDNPDTLVQGLNDIARAPRGQGTDGRVAFRQLEMLLASARPNARKAIIFYTDGEMYPCPSCADEIREAARKLRDERAVDFYSVGAPYRGSDPLMIEVTGDTDRVFDPANPAELASMFQEIKVAVSSPAASASGPRTGRPSTGQLSHRLDGRHFSTPLGGTNWMPGSHAINLSIRPVPEGPATFAHPLVPLSAGLWSVGVAPPRLVFFDKNGQRHQVDAERRPLLLKVTYFTLLLMMLPALLWAVGHIRRRKPVPVKQAEIALPPIEPPSFPEPLPLLARLTLDRVTPVPTLFVGLGGAGRRALHSVRADLKQSHFGETSQPYRFLWVDTDTQEADRVLKFEEWEGYKIETLIAPPAVRQTDGYLPEPDSAPEHLDWFNAAAYRDAARPQLNLTDGAKGERSLARLALFRWLSTPNGALRELMHHFQQLAELPAVDGVRQIVIFASSQGGIGSGWFLDFGRLFQRIARQQLNPASEALPDIVGVLCEDPERRHPENRAALMMELETAMTARKFPQRITYGSSEALLDQVDAQSPYHWVFSVTAGDKDSVAGQCGEIASVLVERNPRSRLLDQAQAFESGTAVGTLAFSAHVLPTLVYDQVRKELFLRLLGPDVLLDVVPDAQGGLKPQSVSNERADQLLSDWSSSETPGSPLQLLLRAAFDRPALSAFVRYMQAATFVDSRQWFGEAFANAVTQRLQGHAVADGGWERGWKPGEAVAALRLLAVRLERLKPEFRTLNAPAQAGEVADHVISIAKSAADDVERWVKDFCRIGEQVAEQRNRLEQARRNLLRLQGRVYLDLDVNPDQIKQLARKGLEAGFGTSDTVSAIRRSLFFAVAVQGETARVFIHSFISKQQQFDKAEDLTAAIEKLSDTLALNISSSRIGGVLSTLSDKRQVEIAHELVRGDTHPTQTLLVAPQSSALPSQERQALEKFGKAIPRPPTHGARVEDYGHDHSAIRRFELAPASASRVQAGSGKIPFVERPESIAEGVRHRAERKYAVALPVFPPRLRIALSHPAAFRSFARAYKAGRIVLRQDQAGRDQWSIVDTGQFLTFERESSLAHAAANYARDLKSPADSFEPQGSSGNFDKLEHWRTTRIGPDADTLTQLAIYIYEE